ncbi:MAG: MGMT family protein [Steroidobacteraceae bacterium]|jgi:methylated-DNA-protein-cysteine methyltransferase-like protein
MASSSKAYSELFLPLGLKSSRSRHPLPVNDNRAIQAIWEMVCRIPRGQVSTYGAVARAAGLPGRARLTGFALRIAPKDLNLPWHRVVGAGGRIVFPKSSVQHREQAKLLRAEGVVLNDGRVMRSSIADLEQI